MQPEVPRQTSGNASEAPGAATHQSNATISSGDPQAEAGTAPSGVRPRVSKTRPAWVPQQLEWLWAPEEDREVWSGWRSACANILEVKIFGHTTSAFDVGISLVITCNVMVFIPEINAIADCDLESETQCTPVWIWIMNVLFIFIYTVELALRIAVHRRRFFTGKWNWIDILIVFSAYFSLLGDRLKNARKLQIFRLVRVARVLRMLRIIIHFPTLHFLVRGFAGAFLAMWWGLVLIMLLVLMWAILAVEIFHPIAYKIFVQPEDSYCADAFNSVQHAVLLFFQTLVAGDAWSDCTIPLIKAQPLVFFFFASVLVSIQLGFTNLVLAIIVDQASKARYEDQEDAAKAHMEDKKNSVKKWADIVDSLDTDGDGGVSLPELLAGQEDVETQQLFNLMDMDQRGLEEMFNFLDLDHNGEIYSADFVDAFYKAHTQDNRVYMMIMKMQLTKVQYEMKEEFKALRELLQKSNCVPESASCGSQKKAKTPKIMGKRFGRSPSFLNGLFNGSAIDENSDACAAQQRPKELQEHIISAACPPKEAAADESSTLFEVFDAARRSDKATAEQRAARSEAGGGVACEPTAIVTPWQATRDGSAFITGALKQGEEERLTAKQCLEHVFLDSIESAAEIMAEVGQEEHQEEVKGEFKEQGANAAVKQRRQHLVPALEEVQNRSQMAGMQPMKLMNDFEVEDKRAERTTKFEWWSPDRVEQAGFLHTPGSAQTEDKGNALTEDVISKMMEEHHISTANFGQGQAKQLSEFMAEVQAGESRLMLDATRHKNLVRVIDVVLLRIVHGTGAQKRYLIKLSEKFPDGRIRDRLNNLPGTKKRPHENGRQVVERVIEERLKMADCNVVFDFVNKESFEDDEESPSYPGVRTVYRKEIYEGHVVTKDVEILKKLGLEGEENRGQYVAEGTDQYTRNFCWASEGACFAKGIKFQAPKHGAEISPLVPTPVGYSEEELQAFLEANHVDLSAFAETGQGSLANLAEELQMGDAALVRQPDGRILRVVEVIVLTITKKNGDMLVQAWQKTDGGAKKTARLPGVKRRQDENLFWAAHRMMTYLTRINENMVKMDPEKVVLIEEEKPSEVYTNLPTIYRRRIIPATLVEE